MEITWKTNFSQSERLREYITITQPVAPNYNMTMDSTFIFLIQKCIFFLLKTLIFLEQV